jgi:hypothetical protein
MRNKNNLLRKKTRLYKQPIKKPALVVANFVQVLLKEHFINYQFKPFDILQNQALF